MLNGASYDGTEKALVFDGTDDYVSMSDWKYNTGFIHSFSGWVKFNSPERSWGAVYGVGDASGSSRTNFTIYSRTNSNYFRTEADGSGSYIDHTFEFTGNMDKWLHMAVVKSSARVDSTRIYINGVLLPQTTATLADREIALPSTPQNFNLNGAGPNAAYIGNVNLSNVKFYDVALTADEVKRLYDMGRLGNVIAQPVHIAAPLYAPGVPVQFVSAQVHDKVAYSTAETTHISPLDISITPHFSNSKIYLMWRIEHEVHHDANFRIYRDGTLIGYNTVSGDVQWSGVTTATYDQNTDSTPEQSIITWIDEPNTTSTVTYKVYMKRSGTANWAFYLNRPAQSAGSSAQETGVSQKTAMEIAQ
jgi:hypothetical protein